jgi:hypothetical protein
VIQHATAESSRLTTAEAVAAALCTMLAVTIVVGYVWGRVGVIMPAALLVISAASLLASLAYLLRRSRAMPDASTAVAAAAIFAALAALLVYFAWPTLLPPGRGSDLTHHLMLIDFVERNWRLPDATVASVMMEMAHYTPGFHLLAALVGDWAGTDGFHAAYMVLALTVALKAVFVFLIAARELPSGHGRAMLAFTAVALCLLPAEYVLGSFVHDSFLAQVAAELFAVGMWWAVVVWDARPSRLAACLFATMGIAAFLIWPMWVGPPIVALVAVAATREAPDAKQRVTQLVIAIAPIATVAAAHSAGRLGWLAIAGTTGVASRPPSQASGWVFAIAAAAGMIVAVARHRSRVTLLITLSIVVQAVTLWLIAQTRTAGVPVMALKMVYFAVYPLAVLGALGIAAAIDRATRAGWPRRLARAATLLVAIAGVMSLARFGMPEPIASDDLYNSGRWTRANLDANCVDYLMPNADTMYWLHLAVLGNSRSSLRTANPATFDPASATKRWIEPAGLPFAIAHLPTLPREVLENVDVLEQFDDAVILSRRGPSTCADARRLAGDAFQTP